MGVGAQLQGARTDRKLSLSDVTQATKIQPWVLEALEADRLQDLMSPIYVKGFLTTYARFLHLDPSPLVTQLSWPQPTPPPAPLPSAPRSVPPGGVPVAAPATSTARRRGGAGRRDPECGHAQPAPARVKHVAPSREPLEARERHFGERDARRA